MKLIELIEQKRRACNKRLRAYVKKGVLSRESYDRLRSFNNGLARELHSAVSIGGDLVKDRIIGSIDDIIRVVKVRSPTEVRLEMFKLIIGSQGRQNAAIRATAANLRSAILLNVTTSFSHDIISSHYGLQGKTINELSEDQMLEMRVSSEIAESIYEYVCNGMVNIWERSEYLQPPLLTLKVVKGGDCDDLTMLLCSLWESIGYETTLHFIPGHCFPGVKLAIPVKGEVEILNFRADPTMKKLNMFKLSHDLCIGKKNLKDLPEYLRTLYEARSFTVPPVEYPKKKLLTTPPLKPLTPSLTKKVKEKYPEISNESKITEYLLFLVDFLRKFISEKLEDYYGDDWWTKGVPSDDPNDRLDVRNKCLGLRERYIKLGKTKSTDPLINFADLRDLRNIILYRNENKGINNWENIFSNYYGKRPGDLLSIFNELYDLRTAGPAHQFRISDEDLRKFELLTLDVLCVEEYRNKFRALTKKFKRKKMSGSETCKVNEAG